MKCPEALGLEMITQETEEVGEESSLESPPETKEELKIERRTRTSQPNGLWEGFQRFCLLFVQRSR